MARSSYRLGELEPQKGAPLLNAASIVLMLCGVGIAIVQFAAYGHLRTYHEMHGRILGSGWTVVMLFLAALVASIMSASDIDTDVPYMHISKQLYVPLAASFMLCTVTFVIMLVY